MRRTPSLLTRRGALQRVVSAGASLVAAPLLWRPHRLDAVVVGGGLCGLMVLRRLVEAGRAAVLLEAAPRIGGRIRTLRVGSREGLRAEAGAERVPKAHARVRALLMELGLQAVAYPEFPGSVPVRFGEQEFFWGEDQALPLEITDGLSPFERAAVPLDLHLAYVSQSHAPAVDDPRSGLQWLKDQGLTPRGEDFLRGFCYLPVDRMPASEFYRATLHEREAFDSELVAGGTDQLVRRLHESHRDRVYLSRRVEHAAVQGDQVRLRDGAGGEVVADCAVFCLPLTAYRRHWFPGGLSKRLRQRRALLEFATELKVHWVIPERLIRSGEVPAARFQDQFPQVLWRLPEVNDHGDCVLTAMAMHRDVPELRRRAASPESLRAFLAERLPNVTSHCSEILYHDFLEELGADEAYTFPRDRARHEAGVVVDGRFIFAGADVTAHAGWMEGAVEAAEEAVQAVLQRSPSASERGGR